MICLLCAKTPNGETIRTKDGLYCVECIREYFNIYNKSEEEIGTIINEMRKEYRNNKIEKKKRESLKNRF